MQNVIEPTELMRLLDGDQVRRFFDHANLVAFALGIAANIAKRAVFVLPIHFAKTEAALTESHLLTQFADTLGKTQNFISLCLQHVKGQTSRGFFSDAGKLR